MGGKQLVRTKTTFHEPATGLLAEVRRARQQSHTQEEVST